MIRFSGTTDQAGNAAPIAETTGWVLSYSPEYQRIGSDPDLLLRLSEISNGQVASPNPADIFAHNLKATRASQPIAPLLLLIAVLLLPFDIAVRRLIITRYDLMRFREWFVRKPAPAPVTTSPRMEALMQAKSRVREIVAEQVEVKEAPVETQVSEAQKEEAPTAPIESTTSALLARKKNRKK